MAKEAFSLTEADVKELTKAIKEHGKMPVEKTFRAGGAQGTFCEVWPDAKGGLTLLKSIIGSIPGVSFFAKAAIDIVIAAGDAAVSALCQ
jgi:hypothetical protein